MAVERLDNSRWGFGSNCFVCEPGNARGMQVPFSHDTDRGVVFAEFTLGAEYSGAPTYLHGGATLALMDEGMSWATIALSESSRSRSRRTPPSSGPCASTTPTGSRCA